MLFTWVEYTGGLDRFNCDVLLRLEQIGIRQPFRARRIPDGTR
jgi:hypothetical protein